MLDSRWSLGKKVRHLVFGKRKTDTDMIDAAYKGILGRRADRNGIQHYSRMLNNSEHDLAWLLRDLVSSNEFAQRSGAYRAGTESTMPRNGAHLDEWIYAGYRALLGRNPDSGGLETY